MLASRPLVLLHQPGKPGQRCHTHRFLHQSLPRNDAHLQIKKTLVENWGDASTNIDKLSEWSESNDVFNVSIGCKRGHDLVFVEPHVVYSRNKKCQVISKQMSRKKSRHCCKCFNFHLFHCYAPMVRNRSNYVLHKWTVNDSTAAHITKLDCPLNCMQGLVP